MSSTLNRRAFSLIEMLVSGTLLVLLLGMITFTFQIGASAWRKTDTQSDLLQDLEKVGALWVREACGTRQLSLCSSGTAMALPQAIDDLLDYEVSLPSGSLIYRRYRLYYWDSASREVRLRNLPFAAPVPCPPRLDSVDLGSGVQSINFYCTGGKALARDVDQFQVHKNGNLWSIDIQARRTRYGRTDPEEVRVTFSAFPRN